MCMIRSLCMLVFFQWFLLDMLECSRTSRTISSLTIIWIEMITNAAVLILFQSNTASRTEERGRKHILQTAEVQGGPWMLHSGNKYVVIWKFRKWWTYWSLPKLFFSFLGFFSSSSSVLFWETKSTHCIQVQNQYLLLFLFLAPLSHYMSVWHKVHFNFYSSVV